MLFDLDGSGSVVMPIGGTAEEAVVGYIENLPILAGMVSGDVAYYDGPRWNSLQSGCEMFSVDVSEKFDLVRVSGRITGPCLRQVVHAGIGMATAAIPDRIRVIAVRGGVDSLPFATTDVTTADGYAKLCWDEVGRGKGAGLKLNLSFMPNNVSALSKTFRLQAGESANEMSRRFAAQERESHQYGICRPFQSA